MQKQGIGNRTHPSKAWMGHPVATLALGDERSRWDSDGTDATGVHIDDHYAQRAVDWFSIEALVEGESLFHGALIGCGFQAEADGEACDFGAQSLLIALDEEDIELAGPDGVLLSEVDVGSSYGDAEGAA